MPQQQQKRQVIDFIQTSIQPFKILIFGQFLVGIFWAVDLSLRPYILKIMLDRVSNNSLTTTTIAAQLVTPTLIYLGLSLLISIIFRLYDYIWLMLNSGLKRHIGNTLVARMMLHSQTLFQNNFAGNLSNKVKDVMSNVPDLISLIIDKFFSHSLAMVLAIFTLATINYKFAVTLAVWLVIFIGGSLFFAKRAKQLSVKAATVRSSVIGKMVDIFSNIMNVKLFNGFKFEAKFFGLSLNEYVAADRKRDWYFLWMFAFQGFTFIVYQAICFVWLISGFKAGYITAGDFALLVTINIHLIDCLWSLSKDFGRFAEIYGDIVQGLSIVLAPIEIKENSPAKPLGLTHGEINFNTVEFRHAGDKNLFENKTIKIAAGEKVGLVGYSGGGKSTFVNLILRMFDVTAGAITIDGQDIRQVTLGSLYDNIAMIPQDPSLFHRSILENIRYGKFDASDAEVAAAAKRAFADEFITKLPHGYNSLVGERGIKLSGGQRQRIAIARAILKNAPILILDEATSQLDSITEQEIQDSIWDLMQNKTTLVIAHRLSTLLHMDRILVFNAGKIVESGSHQELLAKNGVYKSMWTAQINGFLPDDNDDLPKEYI